MNAVIASINSTQLLSLTTARSGFTSVRGDRGPGGGGVRDILDFGSGTRLAMGDSMNVVLERAMEKLRSVVADARAELGIPEGAAVDTSAEATAMRIADFALGAFEAFRRNHDELGDSEAREAFVAFIGAAINQGIEEARGILTALTVLSPEVDSNISTIADFVKSRLDAFLANG